MYALFLTNTDCTVQIRILQFFLNWMKKSVNKKTKFDSKPERSLMTIIFLQWFLYIEAELLPWITHYKICGLKKYICITFIRFFICSLLTVFCSVNCLLEDFPQEKIELRIHAHRSECEYDLLHSIWQVGIFVNNTGI